MARGSEVQGTFSCCLGCCEEQPEKPGGTKRDSSCCGLFPYILYIVVSLALFVGFVVLQWECMSIPQEEFVQSVCLGNTQMRAVIGAVLTVMVTIIVAALGDASCALRTKLLTSARGINEGAFVAMGLGSGILFKLSALVSTGKYVFVLLPIYFLQYGSSTLQPLANLFIETVDVYVATGSTAQVYTGFSYYNTSGVSFSPDIYTSMGLLGTLGAFAGGSNGVLLGARSAVLTNVVRSGFITATSIQDGDASNSIQAIDTVARVVTRCFESTLAENGPLENYLTGSSVNITETLTDKRGRTIAIAALIYDNKYGAVSHNQVIFQSSLTTAGCEGPICSEPKPVFNVTMSSCQTTVRLEIDRFIYNLGTRNVKVVQNISGVTTVNVQDFAKLVVNTTKAPEATAMALASDPFVDPSLAESYAEGIVDVLTNVEQGLFNSSYSNVGHSKICGAVSLTLSTLWTLYDGSLGQGNNFYSYDKAATVYQSQQQVYISTAATWALMGSLAGVTLLLCFIGMLSTVLSPINPKGNSELALMDNRDNTSLQMRETECMANNASARKQFAFKHTLYCWKEAKDIAAKEGDTMDQPILKEGVPILRLGYQKPLGSNPLQCNERYA